MSLHPILLQLAKVRRCQNCRRIGCKDINCQRPTQPPVWERTNECTYCYQEGHIFKNCPLRQIENKNRRFQCGCNEATVKTTNIDLGDPTSLSYQMKHTYHCCGCIIYQERNKLEVI